MPSVRLKHFTRTSVKFMQVLDVEVFNQLTRMAKSRGVSVQEMLRAMTIPDWLRGYKEAQAKKELERKAEVEWAKRHRKTKAQRQPRDRQRRDRRRIRPR